MRVRADSKSYKERGEREREEETEATEQIAMLRGKVAWGEKMKNVLKKEVSVLKRCPIKTWLLNSL